MYSDASDNSQAEAIRLASSVELFGLRVPMLDALDRADFRQAVLVCRRALTGEQENYATHYLNSPREEHMADRDQLFGLLRLVDGLRMAHRTHDLTQDAG